MIGALVFSAVAAAGAALSIVLWGSDAGLLAGVAAVVLMAAERLWSSRGWLRARLARPRWTAEEQEVLDGERRLR